VTSGLLNVFPRKPFEFSIPCLTITQLITNPSRTETSFPRLDSRLRNRRDFQINSSGRHFGLTGSRPPSPRTLEASIHQWFAGGFSTPSRGVLAECIPRTICLDRIAKQQYGHEQTTAYLAATAGALGNFAVPGGAGVVRWGVPHAFFGEPKDLLLRLRHEGWQSDVHAHVRTSQIRESLLG
jgi:hypothetical protein